MRQLLAAARLTAIVLWSVGQAPALFTACLYSLCSPARYTRAAGWMVMYWARGTLLILGVRRTVEGAPPSRGTFSTSNHLGYLDILVLAACYPTVFIAKAEIAGWPILGMISRWGATIWIDRESARDTVRLREHLHYLLERGVTITLFPEGTSSAGEKILPFKASLFASPAALGVACVPGAVTYCTPGAGAGPAGDNGGDPTTTVCWWGDMSFAPHFWRLLQLKRIEARVRFGEPVQGISSRKELSAETRRRIEELFVPIPS